MATTFQVVFDSTDPSTLADFWAAALGYQIAEPPEGFGSWEEWLERKEVPKEEWDPGARPYNKLVDPDGRRPQIWFQRVPEPKTIKNRLHLDLDVIGPGAQLDQRKRDVRAEAERLQGLGARQVAEYEGSDHYHVVMQDPEGNEFCLR